MKKMFRAKELSRLDWRPIAIILALMAISLLVLSAQVGHHGDDPSIPLLPTRAIAQLKRFLLGGAIYLLFARLDYRRLRELTWPLYLLTLLALLGLFFSHTQAGVHRWYRLPLIGILIQPGEFAKLSVVFALSWFLERQKEHLYRLRTSLCALTIAGIPFLLILKQPDLGTALVLWPVTLTLLYFAHAHRGLMRFLTAFSLVALFAVLSIFLGLIDHEEMRPYATRALKNYQYERLNPHTYHQEAAKITIGTGGLLGRGWRKGIFSSRGWLPAAETDSVFPSFGEEFGFVGLLLILALFYGLIALGFQTSAVAKDDYGQMLAAGITVYLAMHAVTNTAMMCGCLPITGVPLCLITYGGSSVLVTMAALGTLQSIWVRRLMF